MYKLKWLGKMKKVILILVVLLMNASIFTLFSCIGGQTGSDKSLNQTEIKSDNLSNILRKTEKMPYLKSLVIFKNGELVVEEYVNGGGPDQIHDIRSASKSVLSAVLGITIKDGYIESIDQKVIDFFPEYNTKELDPRVYDLRIRHLITMKSGFEIKETGKVYQQLYKSNDWIEHILNLPFKSVAGKKFNYHSFNTHLLSATISKATGMSTLEYATQALFTPLGITKVLWEKDPNGYYIGGWGLSLKAQDMAKFGIALFKRWLFSRDTQVVPSEWVKLSTIERTGMIGTYYSGWNKTYGYGYLWWVKRLDNKIDIPFAMGHGGQRIAIMPNVNACNGNPSRTEPETTIKLI